MGAIRLAAKFEGLGEAESEEGGVEKGAAEGGGGIGDGAFREQIDKQARTHSESHGLDGFATGERLQVSEQGPDGKSGGGRE